MPGETHLEAVPKTVQPLFLCYLRINTDDTDEQILEKAHDAEPVRYYIIEDPEGRRAHINLDDLIRMEQAIRDYTIFQLEQPFKLIHRLEKMVKNYIGLDS